MILSTWAVMARHMDDHGPRIFRRIFEVNSKIQKVFKLEGLSAEELERNEKLVKHSKRFMEALEFAVSHMDQLEGDQAENQVAQVFMNLGAHHIYFEGLEDKHFAVFTGSILYVLNDTVGEEFSPDARSAWSRLLDYLIQHIQHGWQQAVKAKAGKNT